MNWRKLASLTFAVMLVLSLLPAVGLTQDEEVTKLSDKIDKELADLLSVNSSADFIATMAEQADLSAAYDINDWNARGQYVYDTLRAVAERSQANAKDYLDKQGLRYQTFIAGNELYVYAGDLDAASALADLPEIASIRAPRTYYIDPIISDDPAPEATVDWGITDTKADLFWAQFGVKGEGIIVSNIDTGVQWNHPALVNQFKCATPDRPGLLERPLQHLRCGSMCDNNGHGTHTMGTMVAKDDPSLTYIAGMAPNAQWIACKGCESSSCSDAVPERLRRLDPGPRRQCGQPAPRRQQLVGRRRRRHLVPGQGAGLAGGGHLPRLFRRQQHRLFGSLGSPGDYQESFGTTGHNSSRDPRATPRVRLRPLATIPTPSRTSRPRPRASAPPSRPTPGAARYSGTSMASPHTAGAVALLWSCNPSLIGQMDATFEALAGQRRRADSGQPDLRRSARRRGHV